MPTKLCSDRGCANTQTYRGYCQRHARVKEQRTNRVGKRIYNSRRWVMTRKRVLFEQPLCEAEGCGEIATDVHHRVDLADGGDPWALENLAALCAGCHGRITRANQIKPPQR